MASSLSFSPFSSAGNISAPTTRNVSAPSIRRALPSVEEIKEKERLREENFLKKHPKYWYYEPRDTYVPSDIKSIISEDKYNRLSPSILTNGDINGYETTLVGVVGTELTTEEYHQTFCDYNEEEKIWVYNYDKFISWKRQN
jgi:hypothetical protein